MILSVGESALQKNQLKSPSLKFEFSPENRDNDNSALLGIKKQAMLLVEESPDFRPRNAGGTKHEQTFGRDKHLAEEDARQDS